MAPPVTYGGFWQHPGLGQPQDVKPFHQNPFLTDKTPTSLGIRKKTDLCLSLIDLDVYSC